MSYYTTDNMVITTVYYLVDNYSKNNIFLQLLSKIIPES